MTKKNSQDKRIEILVSVDDGNQCDLQAAELFLKYNIPAVFYISVSERRGRSNLNEGQIEQLAGVSMKGCFLCKKMKTLFDIGSHTLTHPELDLMIKDGKESEAMKELTDSKTFLENIIVRPVTRFAYPYGRHNKKVREMVKSAGYKSARTAKAMNIDFPTNLYEMTPSIHICPSRKEYKGKTWIEVGYELFDKVIKEGGRFEIYGHSYEIFEQFNMGEFFEMFLSYMDEEMKKIGYPRKILKHGESFVLK